MSDRAAAHYDGICYSNAPGYIETVITGNLGPAEIAGKRVLDFGCGSGDATLFFLQHGAVSVDAVDVSSASLRAAAAKADGHANVRFIKADLDTWRPEDAGYELIWSDTVIELLGISLDEAFRRLARAAVPGALIYVSLIEATAFTRSLYFVIGLVGKLPRAPVLGLVGALVRLRYRWTGQAVDEAELANKLKYLFVPRVRLFTRHQLEKAATAAGLEVRHVRNRLKSDVNSPPHLEILARA